VSTELAYQNAMTAEQVDLIKRTICQGSTADELSLFLQQCKRTGLDPFARQIHAVKRGGKMTIQVGIDGLRLIAQRTGAMDGQDGPYWCGSDGVWRDVWLSDEKPAACKVIVYRKGESRGYTGIARMREYYQSAGGMWDKLPATMIAKVAESIALRKGFPQELSGLYTSEEMDQVEEPAPAKPVVRQLPQSTAKAGLDHIRATFDKCKTLAELADAWKSLPDNAKLIAAPLKDARKSALSAPAAAPAAAPIANDLHAELLARLDECAVTLGIDRLAVVEAYWKPAGLKGQVQPLPTIRTDDLQEIVLAAEREIEMAADAGN
jgi:phage recombination protein Bet